MKKTFLKLSKSILAGASVISMIVGLNSNVALAVNVINIGNETKNFKNVTDINEDFVNFTHINSVAVLNTNLVFGKFVNTSGIDGEGKIIIEGANTIFLEDIGKPEARLESIVFNRDAS